MYTIDQQVPRKLFLNGEWFYCVTFAITRRPWTASASERDILYNYLYPGTGAKCRFVAKQTRGEVIPLRNKSVRPNDGDTNAHGIVQLILLFRANPVSPMVLIRHAFASRIALTRAVSQRDGKDRLHYRVWGFHGGSESEDSSANSASYLMLPF